MSISGVGGSNPFGNNYDLGMGIAQQATAPADTTGKQFPNKSEWAAMPQEQKDLFLKSLTPEEMHQFSRQIMTGLPTNVVGPAS